MNRFPFRSCGPLFAVALCSHVALWCGGASLSRAGILASENFGTEAAFGDPLSGSGSGSGWEGDWLASNTSGAEYVTPAERFLETNDSPAPSVGNVGCLNGRVNTRVGRILDTSAEGPFSGWIDAGGNIKAEGRTIYIAWTWGVWALGNSGTQYYGFEMHRDGVIDTHRILQLSSEGGAVIDGSLSLRARSNAVGGTATWGPAAANFATLDKGDFYVMAITFGADGANDSAQLFINPQWSSLKEDNTPVASISGADLSFDRITFSSYSNNNQKIVEFDDLVVASEWADVVAPSAPGELVLTDHFIDLDADEVTLGWTSEEGSLYRVTSSTDLVDWSEVVQSHIAGLAGRTSVTVAFEQGPARFFRVEKE